MPTTFPLKGFRVVPILAPGSTVADVAAAYAALVVRVSRNSQSRSLSGLNIGVVDDVAVPGPDWIRSPGFAALSLQSGVVGVTYRVWWAEDCFEMVDTGTAPYLDGFITPAPTSSPIVAVTSQVGPAGALTQLRGSAAGNIPTLATDGLALATGHHAAYAVLSAPAAATLSGGLLVWWRFNSIVGRWGETLIQEAFATGRRDAAGLEQLIQALNLGDRLYVEARSVTHSSGAADVVVNLTLA
jgi:hypothetical protein